MKKQLFIALLFTLPLMAGTAHAQRFETQQLYQRIGQLERDMGMLQRQNAQGGGAPVAGGVSNAGQMGAEIARIDEEMRLLRGQIEQAAYAAEQAKKQIEQAQKDTDFRLREIEDKLAAAPAPAPVTASFDADDASEPVSKLGRAELNEAAPVAKTADLSEELSSVARSPEGSLSIPKAGAPLSARDLYNQGFKQLNQTDYKGAEASFLQFTKTYSGDPLVGNAWYWLGEAYYVQRDYVKSANSFRQGYTKLPDGPKAGDNLLKLAMSLSALQKTPEACVVLKQVDKKFSANSEALKNKAREELSRLSCK